MLSKKNHNRMISTWRNGRKLTDLAEDRVDGDVLAAKILLGPGSNEQKQKALKAAASKFAAVLRGDYRCSGCGSTDVETNGERLTSPDLTVRCCNCDKQWEPNT